MEESIEENRGLILVTGHLGNYEWAVHFCILRLKNGSENIQHSLSGHIGVGKQNRTLINKSSCHFPEYSGIFQG
jgi:hypothetical protein